MLSRWLLLLPVTVCAFAANNPFRNFISSIVEKNKSETLDCTANVLSSLGVKQRETKPFYAPPEQILDLTTASLPALLRLGSGVFGTGYRVEWVPKSASEYTLLAVGDYQLRETANALVQKEHPLVLYEFEGCPFCRKVREGISILSLTVTYKPCPKDGLIYRPEIKSAYGKQATFPFLRDANTGIEMFESDRILTYLFRTYGNRNVPWYLSGPWVPLSAGLGLVWRGGAGSVRKNAVSPPNEPLVVYMYEGSPFCKVVREVLCELEIPHTQVSCPRGSPNRQTMFATKGRFQVPYLQDPNTNVAIWESTTIVDYLRQQYGIADPPVKYL